VPEVVLEAEMALVEFHRAVKIRDMDGDVVDALEHDILLE
jgi:hypothetical protein